MKVLFILLFEMDPPAKSSSKTGCRSHKVYLNSWVTEIGGCERVQTNVNSYVFGMDCPSPLQVYVCIFVWRHSAHYSSPQKVLHWPFCNFVAHIELPNSKSDHLNQSQRNLIGQQLNKDRFSMHLKQRLKFLCGCCKSCSSLLKDHQALEILLLSPSELIYNI
jgi:hypothetical protein